MLSLDTNVLIWALQEHKAKRTGFVDYIEAKGEQILIPAPALLEFLYGVKKEEERRQYLNIVTRRDGFFHGDADTASVALASEILVKAYPIDLKETEKSKNDLKIDALIIAISVIRGCQTILSDDSEHFDRLLSYLPASKKIELITLKDIRSKSTYDFLK